MSDMNSESRCPAPPTEYIPGEIAKANAPDDFTHFEHKPEAQVVLSNRLEYLARRVGGCQTDELLALLRRVMYEVLNIRY